MKIFLSLIVLSAFVFSSCLTINSTDLVNTTFQFDELVDCFFFEDLNATILNYNTTFNYSAVNISINETYFNNERNISVSCQIPAYFGKNLTNGANYTDVLLNTFYSCANATIVQNTTLVNNTIVQNCTLPLISQTINSGQCYNDTVRNISVCANNITPLPRLDKNILSGNCYENAERNIYVCASQCNTTIPLSFDWVSLSMVNGQTTNLSERNVSIECGLSVEMRKLIPTTSDKVAECESPMLTWICPAELQMMGCVEDEILSADLGTCYNRSIEVYALKEKDYFNNLNTTQFELATTKKDLSDMTDKKDLCQSAATSNLIPIFIVAIIFMVLFIMWKFYNAKFPNLDKGKSSGGGESPPSFSNLFKKREV